MKVWKIQYGDAGTGVCYATGLEEDGTTAGLATGLAAYLLTGDPFETAGRFTSQENLSKPLRRVLATMPIKTVIIEHGYFDVDYRSEHAINAAHQYRFDSPVQDRVHLFDGVITERDFLAACIRSPEAMTNLEEASGSAIERESEIQRCYLGYLVVRPGLVTRPGETVKASLGRSLVAFTSDSKLKTPTDAPLRIRTPVEERVVLLGLPLIARGVPFMEPDGAVLTCAHVTAWSAHYTAVLKGRIPRRVVGKFFAFIPGLPERPYPSQGLEVGQIVDALTATGLPPEVKRLGAIEEPRALAWYDRKALRRRSVNWQRENLTSTVCRYLNSGVPVVLAQASHAKIVCGYYRQDHLRTTGTRTSKRSKRMRNSSDETRVAQFVIHDDREGLYTTRKVEECLKSDRESDALIIPLPPWVWLPGSDAEVVGARFLEKHLRDRVSVAAKIGDSSVTAAFQQKALADLDRGLLAVRTYVIESSDFKASFLRRCPDPTARKWIGLARLPKYIWVVEMIDRGRRKRGDAGMPPVLGEALIDASAPSIGQAETLVVHLPGFLSISDRIQGQMFGLECNSGYYHSGRWAQDEESLLADRRSVLRHSKHASA